MIDHPRLLSATLLVAMFGLASLGKWIRSRARVAGEDDSADTTLIVSSTLTLLGLIIGFTFSMATTRYDLRRQYEESEANAIGTEWVRADLLPPPVAAQTRALLREYLESRIAFYEASYGSRLTGVDTRSAELQGKLWASIQPAASQPTPIMALVFTGMNDVLNSQGYTQAAWWNRIPTTAWALLIGIACVANLLVGYATRRSDGRHWLLLVVLPVLVSVALFLIADIDSPRGGVIRIPPRDLMALQRSFH